jgi:Cu(I)/Ag(I) efflux system membrane fusion protein
MKKKLTDFLLPTLILAMLLLSSCGDKSANTAAAKQVDTVAYTCSMHPQVIEYQPGNCPICNMRLIKKAGQNGAKIAIGLNDVLKPVSSNVISSVSVITSVEKEITGSISATGYIDFDATAFNNISARFSGRIERLYVKSALQEIEKGQLLMEVYSADMVSAQQDLIYLNKNSANETELINSAKQKLLLLGISEPQIERIIKSGKALYKLPIYSPYSGHIHDVQHTQMDGAKNDNQNRGYETELPLLIKEGMYIEKGKTLFNVTNPHKLWAILKVDKNSATSVHLNQPVKITLQDNPEKIILGKVNFIEPVYRPDDKNLTVRVYLNHADHSIKVNSTINASISSGKIRGLWLPKQAVINLGKHSLVYLKNGTIFQTHEVFTGISSGNEIQIKRGITKSDSLAANAQYLTDSESFIKINSHEKQ